MVLVRPGRVVYKLYTQITMSDTTPRLGASVAPARAAVQHVVPHLRLTREALPERPIPPTYARAGL